jgi:hypothetical protein
MQIGGVCLQQKQQPRELGQSKIGGVMIAINLPPVSINGGVTSLLLMTMNSNYLS